MAKKLVCLVILFACSAAHAFSAPEAEPVITRDMALKAIANFREDPLSENGRGMGAIIIRFVDKSPDVMVRITPKSVPFFASKNGKMPEPEAATLLAAFEAGDVEAQLLRRRKGDDSYAGVLQVLKTYRQIQKQKPGFHYAAIDHLADLEKRGELKSYLAKP